MFIDSFEQNSTDLDKHLKGSDIGIVSDNNHNVDFGAIQDFTPVTSSINYSNEIEEELSITSVQGLIIKAFSNDVMLLKAFSRGISENNLNTLSEHIERETGYSLNMSELYKTNAGLQDFIDLVATGVIVGNRFEKLIPNTNKVYYVTSSEKDSIHFKTNARFSTFKSMLAITSYSKKNLGKVAEFLTSVSMLGTNPTETILSKAKQSLNREKTLLKTKAKKTDKDNTAKILEAGKDSFNPYGV